jgi:nucleotide-binding universal stress UspA family protein
MMGADFKCIILTTDLSEDSIKAYATARSLCDHYNASLTLLTCIDSSMQYSQAGLGALEAPTIYPSANQAKVAEELQAELRKQAQTFLPTLTPALEVRHAALPVEHTIVEFLRESSADLVIMASHGRSGLRRALLGSVAEYVLRHSPCPVLIVPTRTSSS